MGKETPSWKGSEEDHDMVYCHLHYKLYSHIGAMPVHSVLQLADCNTVIDGFIHSDVLDSKSKAWPDLDESQCHA